MIWLDLDETLILTDPMMWGKKGAIQINLEDGVYHSLERPIARKLIEGCKAMDETRILTMGTRDYALAMVEGHGLGFKPEEIVSRCDFLNEKFSGWVYTANLSIANEGVDPNGVLVDNQLHTEGFAGLKMRYLGISPLRYIKISSFVGSDNHNRAHKEVEEILCLIKSLKS